MKFNSSREDELSELLKKKDSLALRKFYQNECYHVRRDIVDSFAQIARFDDVNDESKKRDALRNATYLLNRAVARLSYSINILEQYRT